MHGVQLPQPKSNCTFLIIFPWEKSNAWSVIKFCTWRASCWKKSSKLGITILWPQNNVQHFQWMNESKNLNSVVWQMMPKLLCFKDVESPITCFLFLALFVVLQVIVEWLWWAGFGDGAGSLLLTWQSLWGVWVTVFGDDWCWTFKGVERYGQWKTIWSWLKKRKRHDFSFGNGRN